MTLVLPVGADDGRLPAGARGIAEAESRARGNNAGPPGGLPAPDSYAGSAAPSITGVSGQPPPIFTRQGVPAGTSTTPMPRQGVRTAFRSPMPLLPHRVMVATVPGTPECRRC